MKCPNCDYEADAGLRFCPSCGGALPDDAQVTHIHVDQNVASVEAGATLIGVNIHQVIDNVSIATDDTHQVIDNVSIAADDETEPRQRRDPRGLRNRVKEFWIHGVLRR